MQLGNLNDIHNSHCRSLGVADEGPERCSEWNRHAYHRGRHHPTVMMLHGIAASITNQPACLGIRPKDSEQNYC